MSWQLPARLTARLTTPYSAIEVLPPLALLAWSLGDVWATDAVSGSRALVTVALTLGAVAVVARHRTPFASLCLMSAAVVVPAVFGTTTTSAPGVLLLVMAVFASGRYGSTRSTWVSLPVAIVVAAVGSAAGPVETLSSSWAWSLNVIWIWGLARWLRESDRRVRATREQADALARAAAAEERLRVARDLHDVLAHSLSMMVVQAEVADELLDKEPERARAAVRNVQRTGREALRETRSVLGLLRDASHRELGRTADLPALVEAFRAAGLPIALQVDSDLGLTGAADEGVFRVVQESLTNTLRHAGPTPTWVSLCRAGARVTVTVEDDGRPGAGPPSGVPGHGLTGMRERIESCGGRLTFGPRPHGGFRVEAVLPRSPGLPGSSATTGRGRSRAPSGRRRHR